MAKLRIANLGAALAGSQSTKAAAARRARAKHLYYEQLTASLLGEAVLLRYIEVRAGTTPRSVPVSAHSIYEL